VRGEKRAQKHLRFYPWPMIRLVRESAAGQTAGGQAHNTTPSLKFARICNYFEFLTAQMHNGHARVTRFSEVFVFGVF
jgi:hypothetical protein